MDVANAVSVQLGLLDDKIRFRISKTLRKVRRQTQFPDIDIDAYLNYLKKDKKNLSSGIRLILTKGFGDMFLTTVDADDSFRSVVAECFMNFQQENV